jgi:Flp pilus assembly protein TadG
MASPANHRLPLARARLARLLGDRRGATAVEFAMVAAPLCFMLFALIELALVFMVSSSLENATADAARTIRTGATQSGAGKTVNDFRNAVCDGLGWLSAQCKDSSNGLAVDVRAYNSFRNQNPPDPLQSGTFDKSKLIFNTGGPGDIVLVRVWFPWKLVTPFLQTALSQEKNGTRRINAVATFKNEPWGS